MSGNEPLVTILTPVFNGAPYLAECIESVLAQKYSNWKYIIVNNCSTDDTLTIAEHYVEKDKRISVCTNNVKLEIIANHNKAFHLISSESKYCKVVSADDWLFAECIARMVELAEANSSVGIVGAYQLSGGCEKWYVRTDGLPYHRTVIAGREICRGQLLGTLDVLGNPTSTLYRADLVRATDAFYPNATAEADVSACLNQLRFVDFGFVHQVLSYERLHEAQMTTTSKRLNAYLSSKIGDVKAYGSFCLTKDELETRINGLIDEYYRFLGCSGLKLRDRQFWKYHSSRLAEIGYPLKWTRVARAMLAEGADLTLNPKHTAEKLLGRVGRKYGGA